MKAIRKDAHYSYSNRLLPCAKYKYLLCVSIIFIIEDFSLSPSSSVLQYYISSPGGDIL